MAEKFVGFQSASGIILALQIVAFRFIKVLLLIFCNKYLTVKVFGEGSPFFIKITITKI